MTDLIIFDCDGVLMNSEELTIKKEINFIQNHTCSKFSVSDYVNKFTGLSEDRWIKAVNELRSSQNLKIISPQEFERFKLETDAFIKENINIMPGVEYFLSKLKKPLAVASNNSKENLYYFLRKTGLEKYFQANIFSADVVASGKPEPDLFLYIAKKMNYRPSNCVVVEDSINGIVAAKKAGMKVVRYAGGSSIPAKTILNYGVEGIIESFLEDIDYSIYNLFFNDDN